MDLSLHLCSVAEFKLALNFKQPEHTAGVGAQFTCDPQLNVKQVKKGGLRFQGSVKYKSIHIYTLCYEQPFKAYTSYKVVILQN